MQYTKLGRTGIEVSRHCLGAMMFGPFGNPDQDDCVRIIHAALDAGVNFIDTADVYSQGVSEEIVGKALKGRRDSVVLATKFFGQMARDGDGRNRQGSSRRWIMRAVEDSLRRLDTDWIDLYQQHRPSPDTDIEETLSALSDLVRQGKVRVIGSSAFPAERVVEAQWAAERRATERFRCEQAPYSLFRRGIERDVLPTCGRYGMGVITYSPLDGSWLSGRYREVSDLTGDARMVKFAANWGGWDPSDPLVARRLDLLAQLFQVADKAGLPLSHLATAFCLDHRDVTAAIIGPRTMEQLTDSLASADVRLDADVAAALDEIVPPGTDVSPIDPSRRPAELGSGYRRGS